MSTRRLVRGLSATVLSLLTLVALPAAASAAGSPVSLRDGVVIDAAQGIAYIAHPQGGVAAIDLQRGGMLWHSAAAERPLTLSGDLLVAQARPGGQGELRVVALDVRRQGARSAEADLPMPAGIRAEAGETMGHLFRVSAVPSAQGVVVLWESQNRPALQRREGPPSGNDATLASLGAKRTAWGSLQGSALFDPRAGRLLPVEADQGLLLASPSRALAASLAASGGGERRFASIDGRHVLSSRQVGRLSSAGNPYLWTISEAATGRVLGSIESRVSMSPFLVVGDRIVHLGQPKTVRQGSTISERPLHLHAVDLASGREAWSAVVRDTAFQGPTPE
ncbi:MAG TPA: hypothetical protein VMW27_22770 [Thermoanaerobaculia bacterium]|nr:hypothetical protein [Thermoanaerobaculia bacterium]